jgi:hypothetical protein
MFCHRRQSCRLETIGSPVRYLYWATTVIDGYSIQNRPQRFSVHVRTIRNGYAVHGAEAKGFAIDDVSMLQPACLDTLFRSIYCPQHPLENYSREKLLSINTSYLDSTAIPRKKTLDIPTVQHGGLDQRTEAISPLLVVSEATQKRQDMNNELLLLDFRTGERKEGRDRRANIYLHVLIVILDGESCT